MEATSRQSVFRFGTFEVDVRSGELRKSGVRVRLQEKPFRVLVALLARADEVVTREELQTALWPAGTFVDFDNGLNNAVNRLRSALGDNADTPRFVETVGRRGYRFVFPIIPARPAPETSPTPPAAPQSRRSRRLPIGLSVAGGLLLLLVVAALVERSRSQSRPPLGSIAVLPLANHTGDPSQEYFADGMTEALIAELARIRSLRVIARTSVMQYRGTTRPLSRIAGELGVDAIVEGSVARSGDRVRINAQLIEGASDSHLWAETYYRDIRDVLSLQREVARAIAGAVRAELARPGSERADALRAIDPEAFDLYLRGRDACTMREPPERLKEGVEFLREAVARDSKYPQAHAALGECYLILGTVLAGDPPAARRAQAAAAARTALALDDGLASAHALLAVVDTREWRWAAAEEGYRRAMDLAPSDAAIRADYALYLAALGRFDEALAEARLAESLDPLSLHQRTSAGMVLQLARRQDEAIRQFQRVLAIDPKFLFARWLLGISYTIKGMQAEAIECFAAAEQMSSSPSSAAWRAYALARAGRRDEAHRILEALLARAAHEYVPAPMIAFVYLALGDLPHTFQWLERGYAERSNAMRFLGVYEFADPLRSDPRFIDLLRRMGLPPSPKPVVGTASISEH